MKFWIFFKFFLLDFLLKKKLGLKFLFNFVICILYHILYIFCTFCRLFQKTLLNFPYFWRADLNRAKWNIFCVNFRSMSRATLMVSVNTRNAGSFYAKSNSIRIGWFGWCNTHQLCVQSTDTKTCEIASIISSLPSFKCQWMHCLQLLFFLFSS